MALTPGVVLLDTNIWNYFAKDESTWKSLDDYLDRSSLTLGISIINFAELAPVTRIHEALACLMCTVRCGEIKSRDALIDAEKQSHPDDALIELLDRRYVPEDQSRLLDQLSGSDARTANETHLEVSEIAQSRLASLNDFFPPASSGRYETNQVIEFANLIAIQRIILSHREFYRPFSDRFGDLRIECFRSIRISALVTFLRYYAGHKIPQRSDFGDLNLLYSAPYCRVLIVENNLREMLVQAKKLDSSILSNTEIRSIDFVRAGFVDNG